MPATGRIRYHVLVLACCSGGLRPGGAEHRFTGYDGLSVPVTFARPSA